MSVLQQRLALALDRLATVQQQQPPGVAGELELMRARLDVKETELSLQKAMEQVRASK